MTISELNGLDPATLRETLRSCCGSTAWVHKMLAEFPVADTASLLEKAARTWQSCGPEDGLEAFSHHPKIGARTTEIPDQPAGRAAKWSAAEQSGAATAPQKILQDLAAANKTYEEKFGYIYIVCATGKSANEMLGLLNDRLGNPPEKEIGIAMAEQAKITRIRLEKLLA